MCQVFVFLYITSDVVTNCGFGWAGCMAQERKRRVFRQVSFSWRGAKRMDSGREVGKVRQCIGFVASIAFLHGNMSSWLRSFNLHGCPSATQCMKNNQCLLLFTIYCACLNMRSLATIFCMRVTQTCEIKCKGPFSNPYAQTMC